MAPDDLERVGLGLEYGSVRLVPVRPEWSGAVTRLMADIHDVLGPTAAGIEHVGSTAVPGLMAKPIVDIAVLLAPDADIEHLVGSMATIGFAYRGDAGDDGGLVFVLEVRPGVRVAHLHAIADGDPQWTRYGAFVDLLRTDPVARATYQGVKRSLATEHPSDRRAYTEGKTDVVGRLLADPAYRRPRPGDATPTGSGTTA